MIQRSSAVFSASSWPLAAVLGLLTSCSSGGGSGGAAEVPIVPLPALPEICDNGIDDDLDGLVDCDDPDCSSDPACSPGDVFVAVTGTDHSGCGAPGDPCRTIQQGIHRASSGERVDVSGGIYDESWIQLKSGVTVYSADGPLAARIDSGGSPAVRLEAVVDAEINGFEIYGDLNQGGPIDGLLRIHNASDVRVRNCMVHDAPADGDVIKVTETDGLLLDGVVAYNPALRIGSSPCGSAYQEVIDLFGLPGGSPPVRNVTVRGSWLFHTASGGDYLMYAKRNTANILLEENVFGPSAGGGCGNPAVAIGNSESSSGGYHVDQAIVRNNLFTGLKGDAAFTVTNSRDVWIYGNTFYANSGSNLDSVIMFRGNQVALGEVALFDNLFVNNAPTAGGGRFIWNRDAAPSPFLFSNNLFVGNVATSDIAYTGEVNSVYGRDPLFLLPGVPSTANPSLARIDQIQAAFQIGVGSPAIDAGIDCVGAIGHPSWSPFDTSIRRDVFWTARPSTDDWDMGMHERTP